MIYMSVKSWLEWWGRFLGLSPTGYRQVVDMLRQRYIEEIQHVKRFTQHAQRMHYPQFREKLLRIASDEAQHAEWIAEQITLLGGKIPVVPEIPATDQNSWQYLLADLDEEKHCAAELMEQIQSIGAELPGVTEVLQRISQDGEKHREEIREMLMRSDPQSLWPA
jgi:bacterioferritin (cytochrome b1)